MYFYSIYFYNLQYTYVFVYMYSHMTCSDGNLSVAAVFICVLLQVVSRRRSVSSRGAVGLHVKVASTRFSRRRGGVADGVLGDLPVTRRGRAPSGDQLYVHVY